MKKFILAASLLAPLAVAAPAFAQGMSDAAGFIETPSITTYAPNQPREFTSHRAHRGQTGLTELERSLIDREQVPDPSRLPAR
ncbi:hypothetical protein [Phreatobacter stygius]|uniref:Alpha/beta hydrolase n=1 Tax=Phreatobacter stygius TaxID=1940610 RepID=A0A4D7B967_9HYPH|nr:hypothetical protein [Phreatobacter stygius]QCI66768.1 hypothetical protein E8M01_22510 [Phreatobacter stygius]